jgi:hypothetical protein
MCLTACGFQALLSGRDPEYQPIVKSRRSFVYNNVNFELDYFKQPHAGLMLLEAYMPTADDAALYLPPFLAIEREVTQACHIYNARVHQ